MRRCMEGVICTYQRCWWSTCNLRSALRATTARYILSSGLDYVRLRYFLRRRSPPLYTPEARVTIMYMIFLADMTWEFYFSYIKQFPSIPCSPSWIWVIYNTSNIEILLYWYFIIYLYKYITTLNSGLCSLNHRAEHAGLAYELTGTPAALAAARVWQASGEQAHPTTSPARW